MISPALHRRGLGAAAVVWVSAALFSTPFVYLGVRSAAIGEFLDVVSSPRTLDPLRRSLVLATAVTVLATVLGTTLAWGVTRLDLPGRRVLRVALVLPLVIPSFVGAYAYVSAFAPGGLLEQAFGWRGLPEVRGLWGALFVLTLLSYPYVLLAVAPQLMRLPPSLEESARLLGRSPGNVARTIVWPQISGSVLTGATLVFLYTISDFGAVNFVQYDTLTRKIFESRLDPDRSTVYSLLLGGVALSVALISMVLRGRVLAVRTGSARPAVQYPSGRLRPIIAALSAGVVALGLVIPLGVLTWWVVRGRRSGGRRSVSVSLADAAFSSSWLAVVAAVTTVVLVLPLAATVARRPSRSAATASVVVNAAFALPGIVIALALVRIFVGTVAYQTYFPLLIAYSLHFGGQALGVVVVAFDGIPPRLGEAARMLGAGRTRRALAVDLPLLGPGLAAAGGIVLLSVMKELPATLMLRPIGVETLATRIERTAEDALLIDAGQLSLVLVAVSAVLTSVLVLRPALRR